MKTIDDIIDNVLGVEGGYVDNPNDRGGKTNWGITEKTARAYGYKGEMKDLRKQFAKEVYLAVYFLEPHFDRIFDVSPSIAAELVDCGINTGLGFTKPLIQKSLNLLNRGEKDFKDIDEDGIIGENTIFALKSFLSKRGEEGEKVLLKLLNILQGYRYVEICLKNKSQEIFIYGWLKNRVNL